MGVREDAFCSPGLGQLGLVEVGLEAGLQDVEGGGQDTGCHASDAYSLLVQGYDIM